MKIVLLGGVCLRKEDLARLQKIAQIEVCDDLTINRLKIVELLQDAQIVVSEFFQWTSEILNHLPNLRLIALVTTGYDTVDLTVAQKKNIIVCNAPTYAMEAVAEHTIGLMLAASRGIVAATNDMRSGTFSSCRYQGIELFGKTVGIIGYGRIGRAVAAIAKNGFNMKTCTFDHGQSPEDLNKLLATSDIISLHLPLTKDTHNFINQDRIARMKDGVIIVNTARGGLIDETAFVAGLQSGKIRAAGLDVFTHEPPDFSQPLFSFANVVITPHIAFNTDESQVRRSAQVTDNILAFITGSPVNMVCEIK